MKLQIRGQAASQIRKHGERTRVANEKGNMEGADELDDDVTICKQKRKGASHRRNPLILFGVPNRI